ncbi:MAG: hypothetical protein FWD47_13165 [Treponema sp.]|nr:hypothetical protein [Treponema sp.]
MKAVTKSERIFFLIVCIVSIAMGTAFFFIFSAPALAPVINEPIRDREVLERILLRINEENVKVIVSDNGIIMAANKNIARRIRVILVIDNLIPESIEPWNIFCVQRWTVIDFERNIRFRMAQEKLILDHLKAIDDIDDVQMLIVWPSYSVFMEPRPVLVSVRIIPEQGSDITQAPQNRRKLEGIIKILEYAIEGLQRDYIVITDNNGIVLNDFISCSEELSPKYPYN